MRVDGSSAQEVRELAGPSSSQRRPRRLARFVAPAAALLVAGSLAGCGLGSDEPSVGAAKVAPAPWQAARYLVHPSRIGTFISMAASDQRLVVAEDEGRSKSIFYTSTDGQSWSKAEAEGGSALAIAADPKAFVAVGTTDYFDLAGASAVAWSSVDGTTWKKAETANSAGAMVAVAAGHNQFVAVGGAESAAGRRATAWRSSDGSSWQSAEVPTTAGLLAVAATSTGWIAVASDRTVWLSNDGLKWTTGSTLALPSGQTSVRITAVTVSGSRLLVCGYGNGPVAWVSDDATHWTSAQFPERYAEAGSMFLVAAPAGGGFLGGGTDGLWATTDGSSWVLGELTTEVTDARPTPSSPDARPDWIRGIAVWHGLVWAVASSGDPASLRSVFVWRLSPPFN
jgi:hypothetical protein